MGGYGPVWYWPLGVAVLFVTVGIGSFMSVTWVSAQSSDELRRDLDRLNEQIEDSQSRINQLQEREDTLENRLESIEADIGKVESEIALNETDLEITRNRLETTKEELEQAKELMRENARTLYKNGEPSTIEVLFSSDNFLDFINRREYLQNIREKLNQSAEQAAELESELTNQEARYEQLESELAGRQVTLAARQSEQQELLAETRGEEVRFQERLAAGEEAHEAAQRQLNRVNDCIAQGGTWDQGRGECSFPPPPSPLQSNSASATNSNNSTTDTLPPSDGYGNVAKGQAIGSMGQSGAATGPHLHFEVQQNGSQVNPGSSGGINYGYGWPVGGGGGYVSQGYGCVSFSGFGFYPPCPSGQGYWHNGLDIAAAPGTPILAAANGQIVFNGWMDGYGNTVMIRHDDGRVTLYAHMQ